MKPPMAALQILGHESSGYIHEIWVVGKTENINETAFLFTGPGFIINKKKPIFKPTTT